MCEPENKPVDAVDTDDIDTAIDEAVEETTNDET